MTRTLIFLTLAMLVSCKGKGVSVGLSADPEFVCIPGETELSWSVVSSPASAEVSTELSVVETDDETFTFSRIPFSSNLKNGSHVVGVPAGTTVFEATSRVAPRVDRERVEVYGMSSETLDGMMTFEPDCAENGSINGWQSVTLSGYSGRIAPRGITNNSDRQIVISHGGVVRPLEPRETSSAWNGTNLGGLWEVSAVPLNRARRGADTVTESCDPDVGSGGVVSTPIGDPVRTVPLAPLQVAFSFGCVS